MINCQQSIVNSQLTFSLIIEKEKNQWLRGMTSNTG
jgi:hypothetical protein